METLLLGRRIRVAEKIPSGWGKSSREEASNIVEKRGGQEATIVAVWNNGSDLWCAVVFDDGWVWKNKQWGITQLLYNANAVAV